MPEDFFDQFFFWIFITASMLTAIDWWIGPDGRARMRDKAGDWWLHVTETSFTALIAEDAQRVRSWLIKVFGQWLSVRAVLLCTLISVLVSITIIVGTAITFLLQAQSLNPEIQQATWLLWKSMIGWEVDPADIDPFKYTPPSDTLGMTIEEARAEVIERITIIATQMRANLISTLKEVALPLALANAMFDWVSLGATLNFLGWMARSLSAARLFLVIAADIVLAICLAIAVVLVVGIYNEGLYVLDVFANGYIADTVHNVEMVLIEVRQLVNELGVWEGVLAIPIAILFTSALPTILHLVIATVFLGSKLFKPVLQPVIGRLLYLFHASQKGVLTQIAIDGGILIKVGQETLKYMVV